MRPSLSLLTATVSLALFASHPAQDEYPQRAPGSVQRRDSAGIEIVQNAGPLWRAGQGWSVAPTPFVEIGRSTDSLGWFTALADAVRLPGGKILAADIGALQLRMYDSTGKFVSLWARSGSGPGELARPVLPMRGKSLRAFAGDSVLFNTLFSLMVFTPPGNFGYELMPQKRIFTTAASAGTRQSHYYAPQVEQRLPNGRLLMWELDSARIAAAPTVPNAPRRRQILSVADDSGKTIRRVGEFWRGYPPLLIGAAGVTDLEGFDCGPVTLVSVTHVYDSVSCTYEIRITPLDGGKSKIVRTVQRRQPVTAAEVARFRAFHRGLVSPSVDDWIRSGGASPSQRESLIARLTAQYDSVPLPGLMPAFATFLVDSDGYMWVREFIPTHARQAPRWTVFDPTGRELGPVRFPRDARVLQIGSDFILAQARDEDGVDLLRMYRLSRTN